MGFDTALSSDWLGLDNSWISHLMFWGWPLLTSCSPDNAPICLPTLAVTELRLRPPMVIVTPLTSEVAASLLQCVTMYRVSQKKYLLVFKVLKLQFWSSCFNKYGQFSSPQDLSFYLSPLKIWKLPLLLCFKSCFYTSVIHYRPLNTNERFLAAKTQLNKS